MADLSSHSKLSHPQHEVGQVARALLAELAGGGSQTVSSLSDRLRVSPNDVELALQVLIVGGRIEVVASPEECTLGAGSTPPLACGSCAAGASCASLSSRTAAGVRRLRIAPRDR
jgi:hypothetical protein